jgi:hypothetical protein
MEAILMPRQIGERAVYIEARSWQGSLADFIEALKKGVTQWINTRPEGQREWTRKGAFTIAELAGYTPDCFLKGTSLGQCLNGAGIVMATIKLIDTDIDSAIVDADANTNLYEGEGDSLE